MSKVYTFVVQAGSEEIEIVIDARSFDLAVERLLVEEGYTEDAILEHREGAAYDAPYPY